MTVSSYTTLIRSLQTWPCQPCAVLVYVDIRDMRLLNRIAGPRETDQIIHKALAEMAAWAGPTGLCARLWSNEFVAIRLIDHPQSAVDEATVLRDRLAAVRYTSSLGDNHIAVAMGLVAMRPGQDWAQALADAAEACQNAKRRGINQIFSHVPHAPEALSLSSETHLVSGFRDCMAQGRLSMHPQPIMAINRGAPRLAKAEFLLRMEREGRYVPVPPGTIETLEYFGLSTELDGFSTQSVLEWLAQHPQVLQELDSVSINLSARSIVDGNFMDGLLREVRNARLPAGKLCFELTETAAIEHLEVAAEVITEFRRIGCLFSLDDFGSGLCSFGYLKTLPVDEVKIDGRFTKDVVGSAVSQEIVRAIHQVARATGKRTVAEFVDEDAKLKVLQDIGVDYAQGWLFYPAIPPECLLRLLPSQAIAA